MGMVAMDSMFWTLSVGHSPRSRRRASLKQIHLFIGQVDELPRKCSSQIKRVNKVTASRKLRWRQIYNAWGVWNQITQRKRSPAARDSKCHSCSKLGHWSKTCNGSTVAKVSEVETSDYFLGEISGKHVKSCTAQVCVYDKRMEFKLDNGADVTVVPVNTYTSLENKVKLVPSNKVLLGPCRYKMDCVGKFSAHLKVNKAELHEDVFWAEKQ